MEDGFEYSKFYRRSDKLFYSELITNPVDLSSFIIDDLRGIFVSLLSSFKSAVTDFDFFFIAYVFLPPKTDEKMSVVTGKPMKCRASP